MEEEQIWDKSDVQEETIKRKQNIAYWESYGINGDLRERTRKKDAKVGNLVLRKWCEKMMKTRRRIWESRRRVLMTKRTADQLQMLFANFVGASQCGDSCKDKTSVTRNQPIFCTWKRDQIVEQLTWIWCDCCWLNRQTDEINTKLNKNHHNFERKNSIARLAFWQKQFVAESVNKGACNETIWINDLIIGSQRH